MNKTKIINAYFHALEIQSYEHIIKLFDANAIIHSPLYGQINAQQFYKELFTVTTSSKITLKNIFLNAHNFDSAAAHFLYDWTLKDGTLAPFECVDIFEFSEEDKIITLKIIYDTYYIRGIFDAAHSKSEMIKA